MTSTSLVRVAKLQCTTGIIHKWRKHRTGVNLLKRGWPTKITNKNLKNILHKTFGKLVYRVMRQKLNFLGGLTLVTASIILTQHFIKNKTSYTQSDMVVIV